MGTDKKLLLEVSDLKVHFSIKSDKAWPWAKPSALKAVDGVTLRLYEGETLGVVGSPVAANPPSPVPSSAWYRPPTARWCGLGRT